jgi:signal transduction histidine kinase
MLYHWVVPLAAAVANVVMCVPVLRSGIRSRASIAFAWMTLGIVCWNLDIFSLYFFADVEDAELWSRIFRVGICFAPVAAFNMTLVLGDSWGRPWRGLLIGGYAISLFLTVQNLRGKLVAALTPHIWGWYIQPAPLYRLFIVLLVVYLVLSLERGWHAYRYPASSRQRVQAKFWFLAAAVQIPFSMTNLLPAYGINTYPLGNLGNVLYSGIIAYAIVRHRLMDVDYVVRKIVSFFVASAVVLVPGAMALGALCAAFGVNEPLVLVCAAVALALIAVLLVPTLQAALETRVQRAFFPQLYDYRRRLSQLAAALVHVFDQKQLIRTLGDAFRDVLDTDECDIFLRDEESAALIHVYPIPSEAAALPEDVARPLETLRGPILASEVEAAETLAFFREHRWEVGIPLRINERLTGFIALGANKDFRIFSSEDLQLLDAVASGASVALENAWLSRQLRRSEAVLERANRLSSLGTLAAGIAHEIRNPLVAVKTFLDLLPSRMDDREFMQHFRDLSLSELRRVTDLISDLLALGKSTTAERRSVDLGPTLEPVVRLMESTARKRGVELVQKLERGLPPVWADADQVKQIILNLLLNAIEMSPSGTHVTLEVRVVRPASDAVLFEVRDEGPGIPADQQKSIFNPFFTTKETGTGLGLALVHQMVVEHGGEITVESEVGRGSVFRVTLPTVRFDLARTGT